MSTSAYDWGYAVLKKPIPGATVIPLAYGCELEELQTVGASVHLVGYSDNGGQHSPLNPDAFVQRWAPAKILALAGGILTVGGEGTGVRRGDSGSPVLGKTKDGSWRVLGVVSRENGYSGTVRKEMVDWLIKETGIDVTPCYDSDGKPTEGKECDAFRAFSGDPEKPVGKVEEACKGAPTKWAGLACGLKKSDGSDPDANPDKEKDKEKDKDKDTSDEDSTSGDSSGEKSSEEGDSDSAEGKDDKDSTSDEDASDSSSTADKKKKPKKKKKKGKKGKDEDDDEDDEDDAGSNKVIRERSCSLNAERSPWHELVAGLGLFVFWRKRRRVARRR